MYHSVIFYATPGILFIQDASSSVIEDIATSSTAGETTEEELTGREPATDHARDEDMAGSVVSETTTEATSVIVTTLENVPLSSHVSELQQQMDTKQTVEDKETIAEREVVEHAGMVEQEEGYDDDEMTAVSESAATSEVIIDGDDDNDEVVGEEDDNMADEQDEEALEAEEEEVVEEEEVGDEEADDEEDEDVDIEGFETAATEPYVGLSKSDPIELSSDDDAERVPPSSVMLSSTMRSGDLCGLCIVCLCLFVCVYVHNIMIK